MMLDIECNRNQNLCINTTVFQVGCYMDAGKGLKSIWPQTAVITIR